MPIALINLLLPFVIAEWRKAHEEDPNAPTYTAAQVSEMTRTKAADVVATAKAMQVGPAA